MNHNKAHLVYARENLCHTANRAHQAKQAAENATEDYNKAVDKLNALKE
jgi:hypothetical protein